MKASLERISTRTFLCGVMLVAACLYFFHLRESLVFIADVARDTTRALELWKYKEITLIGPPASFGQSGTQQIFFGSLSLYLGAAGLVMGGLDPVAASYISGALFVAAIPALFIFLRLLIKDELASKLGVLVYAISPLTVTHARFFWNANFLIPFAIFFAYCASKKNYLLAGLIAGLMINFHYVTIVYGMGYIVYLLGKRNYRSAVAVCLGIVIASLPLLVFELRNEFYLTHAVLFNSTHGAGSLVQLIKGLFQSVLLIPLTFVGIVPAEISYPTFFSLTPSEFSYNARYLFPVYPLVIAGIVYAFMRMRKLSFIFGVIFFMLATSVRTVMHTPTSREYISLNTIEKIASAIIKDQPQAPYNITENIIGDARAISYRYFLLRDAAVQPESIEHYTNLDTLYVVSPSASKVYKEKRWEFTATPKLKLKHDTTIDTMHLFTYKKASKE